MGCRLWFYASFPRCGSDVYVAATLRLRKRRVGLQTRRQRLRARHEVLSKVRQTVGVAENAALANTISIVLSQIGDWRYVRGTVGTDFLRWIQRVLSYLVAASTFVEFTLVALHSPAQRAVLLM